MMGVHRISPAYPPPSRHSTSQRSARLSPALGWRPNPNFESQILNLWGRGVSELFTRRAQPNGQLFLAGVIFTLLSRNISS